MSEKKEKSKLSLSAKADKFDVPLSTLKKVFRRGVAAWNSGHRPGTTPQQWGHARVNSFLRKGKTYHTADKDLREDAEQLNELDIETYNKYINATYSQSPAAAARKLGQPKHAQRTRGRSRARMLIQKQIDKPEYQEELARIRREHERLHNPNADPSGRGYGEGRYMGDHVEHIDVNVLFEKAMSEVNPFEYKGVLVPKKKDSMDPENQPGVRKIFVPANNLELKQAAEVESSLKDQGKTQDQINREVFAKTGVWKAPGRISVVEIPDDEMTIKPGVGKAEDLISHPELVKRYPDALKNMTANIEDPMSANAFNTAIKSPGGMEHGYYMPAHFGGQGVVQRNLTVRGTASSMANVAAHELQHSLGDQLNIQQFKGADPDNAMSFDDYWKKEGERLARLSGVRRPLNAAERRARYPGDDLAKSDSKKNAFERDDTPYGGQVIAPRGQVIAPSVATRDQKNYDPIDEFKRRMGIKESIEYVNEMQLVGTDEYRDYALAMTPGQDQEIRDAFPSEVYGTEVYEPQSQEESTTAESDGSIESGAYSTSGKSFRSIRKKLQEQEVEELEDEEQIEGEEEEEEGENDGAEDGVDFTPNLKTTKARRYVPQEYAGNAVSGFPVLGISEGDVVPVDFASAAKLRKHPATQQKEKPTLSEAVDYHNDNNISLVENIFRPGSDMFFAMILEAKRLYAEGLYEPRDESEQDLLESDIGEIGEYNGEAVLLDFPFETADELNLNHTNCGTPNCCGDCDQIEEEQILEAGPGLWANIRAKRERIKRGSGERMRKPGEKGAPTRKQIQSAKNEEVEIFEESDPTKGKGIGKPFRSRGGGAVYVKNEKGNVIKVNFSQSGMRKRLNEPARVKSFIARHNCYGNKDRTSASYWACRWPRFFSNTGQQWW